MVEVIVEYDYSATESDELTIKKGDIIREVTKKSGGWWDGVLNDKRGLFPDNFVRPIDKDPVPLKSKKDFIQIRQCRVIFSYKQDHQDELSLNVGDVINIIGEEEEGWWRGVLQGKEGVFPSNFVEEIKPKFSSREDLTTSNENNKSPILLPKRSKILCQVKYSYKAQNEDELSLKEGDIINVINKEGLDPGWWKGELNGKIGVFPDNFVTIISNIDDKVNNDDANIVKSTESAILKPTAYLQRKSLEERHESTNHNNRNIPPIPSKKPLIPIKKSPSGSGSQSGLLAGLRKKIVDVVDGTTSSKSLAKSNEILEDKQDAMQVNVFDQVERTSMLPDVRATRAKAPGRRPPSVIFKENEIGVVNGNVDQIDESVDASMYFYSSVNNKSSEEIKPKLRGWEKHKAPWLEEMKLNQAKRTSTSPGPEQNKLKITHSDICVSLDTDSVLAEKNSSVEAVITNSTDKVQSSTNDTDKNTVVLRNKPPVSSYQIPQTINHSTTVSSTPSPNQKPPNIEKTKALDVNLANTSSSQYNELLERLETLELRFQQQELVHKAAIEDLQNKLQVETDMRRLLQTELDKLSQCIMQV